MIDSDSSTATPEHLEANMRETLKDNESIESEVQKLKDNHLSFEIQIPKYSGTDKQKNNHASVTKRGH